MKLNGQVAIITGAGRNIGEDTAKLFASEGASVAVVDLDKARGEKVAADIEIAKTWKPGTLKDDGKRGGAEKGFRK
jgi:NAD(P)-dependent dehydrogenase (short-subunit alcohol dehydrogenase family)